MANAGALFSSAVSAAATGALATDASTYLTSSIRVSHKTRQDLSDAAFNELKSSSHSAVMRGVGSKTTGSDHAVFFESRRFAQADLLSRVFSREASGAYVVKSNGNGRPLRVAFICAADRELKCVAGNETVHAFVYDASVRDMKRTEQIRGFASNYPVQDQLYYGCRDPPAAYTTAGASRLHLFRKPADLPTMQFDVLIVLDGVYYLTASVWGEVAAKLEHRIAYIDFMAPPELVHCTVEDAQPDGTNRELVMPQFSEFYSLTLRPYVDQTTATYKAAKARKDSLKAAYNCRHADLVKKAKIKGMLLGSSDGKHVLTNHLGELMAEFAVDTQRLDSLFADLSKAEKLLTVGSFADAAERLRRWMDKSTSWYVTLTMLDCHGTHANSYRHDLFTWRAWMGAGMSTVQGDFVFTPMGHYYIHKYMAVNRALAPEPNIVPNTLPKSWIMVRVVNIQESVQTWWPHISESVTYEYVRLSEIMNVLSYVNSLTDETLYGDKAYPTIVAAMRREHTSVNFTNSVVQEPLAKLGVMQIHAIAQTVLVWARYVRERRQEAVKEFLRSGITAAMRRWFGSMFDDTLVATVIARLKRVKELEGLIQVLPRTVNMEFLPSQDGVMINTFTQVEHENVVDMSQLEEFKKNLAASEDWANFEDSPDSDSEDDSSEGQPLERKQEAQAPSESSRSSDKGKEKIDADERKEDGQAKLYDSEMNFLKNVRPVGSVVVHVVGAAPGMHYSHLAKQFPDWLFVLYDKPGREIKAEGVNVQCRSDYKPPHRKSGSQGKMYVLIDDHLDTTEQMCWESAFFRASEWTRHYECASLKLNPDHLPLPPLSVRYTVFGKDVPLRPVLFTQNKKYYQGSEIRAFVGLPYFEPVEVEIPFDVELKVKAHSLSGTCPGRVGVGKDCGRSTKTTDGVRAFCDGCVTGSHVVHKGGMLCGLVKQCEPRPYPGAYECAGCDSKLMNFKFPVGHLTSELAAWRDSAIECTKKAAVYLDKWKSLNVNPNKPLVEFSAHMINICGVPGSGKSWMLRKMALAYHLQTGKRVGVVLPMMKLLDDYRGVEVAKDQSGAVVSKKLADFMSVKTRHKFLTDCSEESFGLIFVDEVYTMSAVEIAYLSRYNVPIILVGDHAQQHLAETHGYGWGQLLIDNGINMSEWISHRLFLNYRNPCEHLKYANAHYDKAQEPQMVGMRPSPQSRIRVMTNPQELQAAYGRNGEPWRSHCEVMAFSKKGYAKLLPDECEVNDGKEPKLNTVRSMQGATVTKPLVLIVDDSFASSAGATHTGTNIVAFTRHKADLIVYIADRASATMAWVKANGLWTLMEQTGIGAIGEVQEMKEPLPEISTPDIMHPPCDSIQALLSKEPPTDDRHSGNVEAICEGPLKTDKTFAGRVNQNLAMDVTAAGVMRSNKTILAFSEGMQTYSSMYLARNSRQIMRTSIARAGLGSSKPLNSAQMNGLREHADKLVTWVVGPGTSAVDKQLLYDSLSTWVDDAKSRHYSERFASANGIALNDFKQEFEKTQEIIRASVKQGVKMINIQKLMTDLTEQVNAWKPPTSLALGDMQKAGQMTATTNIALIIATAVYVRFFTRAMVARMGKDYGQGVFATSAYKSNEDILACLEEGMRSTCTFGIPHAGYEDSSGMDSQSTKDYRSGPIRFLERMAERLGLPTPVGGFANMTERFNKALVVAANLKFTKSEELSSGIIITWLITTVENMFNSTLRVTPIPGSFNYFTGDDAGRFQRLPFRYNTAGKNLLDTCTNIKIINIFNDGDGVKNEDPKPFIFELAGYSVYCDADMSPSVGTMMLRKVFKFLQTPEVVMSGLDSEAQVLAVLKRVGPRINSLRDYVNFVFEKRRLDVEVTHMAAFMRDDQPTVDYKIHRARAVEVLESLVSLVRMSAVDYVAGGQIHTTH